MKETVGLRARKKKETRRLILKSANALFHQKGFSAATLEEIAAKAGVHKQTVLRYFGSKEEIALAFRQVALDKFREGLLDPDRKLSVLEYWRNFIETSTRAVAERGDMLRYSKLVASEPALLAASLDIHMQYEELLAAALSREAGVDPEGDLYSMLLASFLVGGNFHIARYVLGRDELHHYVALALYGVDFAINKFPRREAMADLPDLLCRLRSTNPSIKDCVTESHFY